MVQLADCLPSHRREYHVTRHSHIKSQWVFSAPKRLLGVLEQRLAGRDWVMGDAYAIVDIAIFPWVRNLVGFYEAGELVGFTEFGNVRRVLDAFIARPAVAKGLDIPHQS